ncbi:MAG: sodium:solute symporter [Terriglobales bacterium]
MGLRWLDATMVAVYMTAMIVIGIRFARRQTTTESYFVAKRSVPGWALAMSLLATIISAVTFIAYPGSGYAGNWSMLVPGVMVVVVLALAGTVIIPFYRHVVGISAYEYFEKRFGYPARAYSSAAFVLGSFSKMAFVVYLLALTISSITGWRLESVVVGVAAITIFYTLLGGLDAVIWADVVQGFILWLGILICVGYLFIRSPGGPSAVLALAWANHKFDLGNPALVFSQPTIIVLSIYGFFWYLQKYTADQTMVQRYLASKSDKEALRGLVAGAALCIPVWVLFMFIGTQLWAFYRLTGETLPSYITKADQVFPYFIRTHIPAGIAGLFIAALFGAAMATLSSDLNCLSVVLVEDFYRKLRPHATDLRRLRVAKFSVAVFGLLAVWSAIQLGHTQGTALSLWYTISAIVAGGLAGLFLLGFLSTRANQQGAYVGIVASLMFTAWATLTLNGGSVVNLGKYNFPLHDYMIGAVGHLVLLVVGYFTSFLFHGADRTIEELTLWGWLRRNPLAADLAPIPLHGK